MLLLRALLLWAIISLHVVGGACLFRRLFPRESPWFGLIVPSLALVAVMNFIEHLVAVPTLLGLLPFSSVGCLAALWVQKQDWRVLALPVGIFLCAFAFTLSLRALRPDIISVRDGVVDLSLLASFCMGEKLPPPLIWYSPVPLSHYYAFGQYAMSVLTRLLGLDVGTGFNLSTALLGALDCVLAAAAAWRIGGQKIWIAILAPVLMECAATGATAYLWLTTHAFDPNQAGNLLAGASDPHNHNPLWRWLHPALWYDRRELIAPGAWSWIGSFHSTSGGQFFIFFFAFALAEVLRPRRADWPWICLGAVPFFTIVTSTWALVLEAPILLATAFWIWRAKLIPRHPRQVLLIFGGVVILLSPALLEFLGTSGYPGGQWTQAGGRTQLVEFLLLWWPVYLPWLALACTWRHLDPALKTIIVVLPLGLLGVEFYTVAGRPDWTGKLWGYIYGMGWLLFVPAICARKGIVFHGLLAVLLVSCALSFIAWAQYTYHFINWTDDEIFHLEGTNQLRLDPKRGSILPLLAQMRGQTIICGKSDDLYCEAPALAAFTGNRVYVTWSYFCDTVAGGETYRGAAQRQQEVNDLYEGKCADPLSFLRLHKIAAVVIYPTDNIEGSVVEQLIKQLTPVYEYHDFSDASAHAGIFVYRPALMD